MNEQGQFIGQQQVQTNAAGLIDQVTAIPAERKHLTLEQSNMAFWAAEQLRDHVDRLIVCDPGYNSLISGSENKNDNLDTLRLCRLLRLGELKEIWRPHCCWDGNPPAVLSAGQRISVADQDPVDPQTPTPGQPFATGESTSSWPPKITTNPNRS